MPYAASFTGPTVIWFIPVSCLLPFALFPLFYAVIHKYDCLLFGRYHLALPVSAFVAALFFVLAWSPCGGATSRSLAVFFGSLFFVSAISVYRYCAFSVRARLAGGGIVSTTPLYEGLCALGAVAAVVAFWCFSAYGDGDTAYVDTAYVLGGVSVIFAFVQYLATHYGIPRLGGRKRQRTVAEVFRAFYGGLNKKVYFSALLFETAFACLSALIVYFAFMSGEGLFNTAVIVAVLVGVYAVCALSCTRIVKRRTIMLSAAECVCASAACVILVVAAAVAPSGRALTACLVLSAIFTGAGGAMAVRQTKLRFLTIKSRITVGTVFILLELTMLAAAAIAFTVAAVVATAVSATGSLTSFIYGFAAAAVFAVVALSLAGRSSGANADDGEADKVTDAA